MVRNLLICGLIAGAIGGLLAAGFGAIVGEPSVDAAIAFEEAQTAAAHDGHEHDHDHGEAALVSRDLQKSAGLLTATIVYGVAIGGLFALAFAFIYGRIGRAGPGRTALWLATGAFAAIVLIPSLKYPATPPAVGDPETIGRRTALFLTMIACSLLLALAAARVRVSLVRRGVNGTLATGAAVASYLVLVVAVAVALPGVNEVPANFPATTLWEFRISSLGLHATLWAVLGIVFAVGAERVMTGAPLLPKRRGRLAATAKE